MTCSQVLCVTLPTRMRRFTCTRIVNTSTSSSKERARSKRRKANGLENPGAWFSFHRRRNIVCEPRKRACSISNFRRQIDLKQQFLTALRKTLSGTASRAESGFRRRRSDAKHDFYRHEQTSTQRDAARRCDRNSEQRTGRRQECL